MKRQKAQNNNLIENIIHGVFLIMGLITVGCVLLITVYLVISGIPAIREIGLREFLLGKVWASTAAEPPALGVHISFSYLNGLKERLMPPILSIILL